jgi:hypothetical protein
MVIDIKRALVSNRLMKSMTGLSADEFLKLVPAFRAAFLEIKNEKYEREKANRQRKPGSGPKGLLASADEKLFFILLHLKCYPTVDVMAFFYQCHRSAACRNAHNLIKVLEKTLGKKQVLPKRKISSAIEFFEAFTEGLVIFIDGSEGPIRRPQDNEAQRQTYSGKKKRHTKKNIVICDRDKRIGFLGKTTQGKEHDFPMLKSEDVLSHIPKDVMAHCDLGFQGIDKEFPDVKSVLPQKKPRGKELSADDKEQNKAKSRIRILVENAIAGVKRLRIVSGTYRNRLKDFDDLVMLICAGLWNYHLA